MSALNHQSVSLALTRAQRLNTELKAFRVTPEQSRAAALTLTRLAIQKDAVAELPDLLEMLAIDADAKVL